jgi:hypothetical protein
MPEETNHHHLLRFESPHHWAETEAQVTDCTFAHFRATLDGGGIDDQLAHYAVGFTYEVDGVQYKGVLSSPVEVQPGDTFAIRYNPAHPEENNSVASELDRPWFKEYTFLLAAVILGITLYDIAQRYLHHH